MDRKDCEYLSDEGIRQAQAVMDTVQREAKKAVLAVVEEAVGDAYDNVSDWIDTDAWANFRGHILSRIAGYRKDGMLAEHELRHIRRGIMKNHRDELIKDLNQDLVKENRDLRATFGVTVGIL